MVKSILKFIVFGLSDSDFEKFRDQANRDDLRDKLENFRVLTDYNNWAIDYNQKVFLWEHLQGQIIFWTVIGITSIGILISFLQFFSKNKNNEPTQIKVGKNGVEISSSIIGILILIISLVFLYIYIIYVYPIKPFTEELGGLRYF